CTFAYKDELISSNRIPAVQALKDTCGECKSIVHSIIAAIDNPEKMAEIKFLLNALCIQTSNVVECKRLVSMIEVAVKKLEPYLSDDHTVCKRMHL
ncbi:hypothetical protein PMAYCL1PPCAC_08945, partial [Pristionchus mayeri]